LLLEDILNKTNVAFLPKDDDYSLFLNIFGIKLISEHIIILFNILKLIMDITLLDIGIFKSYNQNIDKVNDLFEIAPFIEELGYKRFWLGEHHEHDCAWRSPEILISLLLASTDKLKIGSAGNLLFLHNALRLVQDYSLLESMFPNRVDMGLAGGRTSELNVKALLKSTSWGTFDEKAEDLFKFFKTEISSNDEFNEIQTPPYVDKFKPNIWFLSTSNSKCDQAIKYKSNYAWSLFHTPKETWPEGNCIEQFKEKFHSINNEIPETALAVTGACIEDEKKAKQLKTLFAQNVRNHIIGSKEQVHNELGEILNLYSGVEELAFCDLSLNLEEKKESCFELKKIVDSL